MDKKTLSEIIKEADDSFGLQQHYNEITPLVNLIASQKKLDSFIEIGSNKGGTFYILSSLIPGMKISIDFCDGGFGGVGQLASIDRNKRLSEAFKDTHFIEGDSHKYDTVVRLKELLGDKKVSVLFIDGDHTFKGCYQDLIIYRQFLKQDGLIVFHDIKETEYHTHVNCRVDLVWREIKKFLQPSDYYEFVEGDASDCTTAMQHATTIGWGGIGAVKNNSFYKRRNTHLFQLFYNQESLDSCLNNSNNIPLKYVPELIIHNEQDHYYENAIIEQIYKNYKFQNDDFIGITSPIVTRKTGLPLKYIFDKAENSKDTDIIVYSPTYEELGLKDADIWQENKDRRGNLYKTAEFLNTSNILPFDLFEKKWHLCYCNYWIAKNNVFRDYVSKTLMPTLEFFSNDKRFRNFMATINFNLVHRGKQYPVEVFVLEGLFGSFISNSPLYKVNSITKKDYEIEMGIRTAIAYKNGENIICRQYEKPFKKFE